MLSLPGLALTALRSAWSWLGKHREFLMLLVVAGVAAYLWFLFETTRSERDRALAWRTTVCSSVGADDAKPIECQQRIAHLAAFERDTLASSNSVRAAAAQQHVTKAAADVEAADRDRAIAGAAYHEMEQANAAIGQDDYVDGDWFAALNRTGGLRAPGR
jgi:hypothetical protein